MFRTAVRRAAGRKPMIKFPDRSKIAQAPQEIADDFSSFQKTLESGPHFDAKKLQDFKALAAQAAFPVGSERPQGPVQTGALDPKAAQNVSSPPSSSASSSSSSARTDVAEDLHDLPPRFWKTPSLLMEETEMDAIMSGGATLVQN